MAATPCCRLCWGHPLGPAQRPRHPAVEQRWGGWEAVRGDGGWRAALKDPEGSFLWRMWVAWWAAASQGSGVRGDRGWLMF